MRTNRLQTGRQVHDLLASVLTRVPEYAYVWEYHPDGWSRVLAESRPWHEFLQVPPGPQPIDGWLGAVHPDDRAQAATVVEAQQRGEDGEHAYRVLAPDGRTRWLVEHWRCRQGARGTILVDGMVTDVTALREAESGREASTSLLSAVIDAVDAYVYCWDYDPDGRPSPSFESVPTHVFLRVPEDTDPLEAWERATHPDDAALVAEAAARRRAGHDGTVEHRVVAGDGTVRWLRNAWRCVRFADGSRRAFGIAMDVTETQAAREAEAVTRARLDAIVASIDDYVYAWAFHPDGRVEVTFESIPSEQFLTCVGDDGRPVDRWRDVVHPDDLPAFDRLIECQRRGTPASAEYRIGAGGQRWRWVYDRSRSRRLADGTVLAEGIVSDVTVVREAQERLRERDAIFRTLAEALPLSVWSEDPTGRVEFVNEQALSLWDLPADGFDRDARRARIHADDRTHAASAQAARGESEFRVVLPDGTVRHVVSRRRAVRGPAGEIVGYVGADLDVTAERSAEAALRGHVQRLDQANAALDQARREADRRSRTDALTGLANRRHFGEALAQALGQANGRRPVALLLLDADRFKAVNDTFGHAVGDAVLSEVAHRVAGAVGPGSVVARWGGEEIAVLLPHVEDDAALRAAAEHVRRAVGARPIRTARGELSLTVSVGAARWEGPPQGADALLDAADRALYGAKRRGRDQVRLATELTGEDLRAEEPQAVRTARALALATAVREGMPELHCEQVSDLSAAIAAELGLPAAAVFRARLGGLLHDVGKVAVPDSILAKPAPLDEDEWIVMRQHVVVGERLVARLPELLPAAAAVRHHHERWDGAGYPDGLRGEAIPIEARIVAVADAYSAMTTDRVYRRGREREAALAELRATAGRHHDPAVVEALARALRREAEAACERLRALHRLPHAS